MQTQCVNYCIFIYCKHSSCRVCSRLSSTIISRISACCIIVKIQVFTYIRILHCACSCTKIFFQYCDCLARCLIRYRNSMSSITKAKSCKGSYSSRISSTTQSICISIACGKSRRYYKAAFARSTIYRPAHCKLWQYTLQCYYILIGCIILTARLRYHIYRNVIQCHIITPSVWRTTHRPDFYRQFSISTHV